MSKASSVVEYALSQVGYEEPNHDNHTKYGEMMDTIYKGFFNGRKDYHDWCCTFVCCSMCESYGMDNALSMMGMPKNNLSAVVKYFYNYMNSAGLTGSSPKIGAVIFFQNSEGLSHVGIVVEYDTETVTTVEGNAGTGSFFVVKNKYNRGTTYIYGYGYPKYDEKPEPIPETYKKGNTYTVSCKLPLMIRKGASTDYGIIDHLNQGDKVLCDDVVIDKDGNTWLKIKGYVCANYHGDKYIS